MFLQPCREEPVDLAAVEASKSNWQFQGSDPAVAVSEYDTVLVDFHRFKTGGEECINVGTAKPGRLQLIVIVESYLHNLQQ